MNLVDKSREFAIKSHNSINQKYNGLPYGESHLQLGVKVGMFFIHLIFENDRNDVISGIWSHDILEDVTSVTYNDLKKATNTQVAELAYACTNEKGKTRSERANKKYYTGIKRKQYAKFIKLCDRIANVQYSLETKSRMYDVYKKEQKHFQKCLTDNFFDRIYKLIHSQNESNYKEMWDYLNNILSDDIIKRLNKINFNEKQN